jgi:hypothetical protein
MAEKATDFISPWFLAAEDLGEYVGIRFGRIAPGADDPEWIFRSHTETDGIGGFAEILRRRGARLERLPRLKHPTPPSPVAAVKLLPKFLKTRQRVKWAPLIGEVRQSTNKQPPSALAWHVFDEVDTMQVRRICRRFGVTINTFLLKHLTKAIRPFLHDESSTVPWMIPVNLRGKVTLSKDTDNYSSYVGIKVRSYESVQDIHSNIYAALASGEHWGHWQVYRLGKLAGAGLKRFLIRKELAMSQWNLGGFSNLGDWDPEKKIVEPACLGDWLFCPPVLRSQTIGAGCITFQNRLALAIQAHPELTANPDIARAWMQNWTREITIDLGSISSTVSLSASAA